MKLPEVGQGCRMCKEQKKILRLRGFFQEKFFTEKLRLRNTTTKMMIADT